MYIITCNFTNHHTTEMAESSYTDLISSLCREEDLRHQHLVHTVICTLASALLPFTFVHCPEMVFHARDIELLDIRHYMAHLPMLGPVSKSSISLAWKTSISSFTGNLACFTLLESSCIANDQTDQTVTLP